MRLLTLVGPGGVGKTRLALQVAGELLEEFEDGFEDGVYFVELASIVEADLVVPTIAAVLEVREVPDAPLLTTLISRLQDKRILLVLDNFEQIISARSALAELLAMCPDLKLLVTSRIALGLRTEQEFQVSPLAMPDVASPGGHQFGAAQLLQYGAIELFAQRARAQRGAMQADFEITKDNANAVVEICRRVDGLPLAIELVAAHARLLSPQSILARLTRPLRLLSAAKDHGGLQDAPSRHQTMRDTIEWSYKLLDEEEQRLFRRLAVFVGGFGVRVAEAVCNEVGDIGVEVDDHAAIEVLEGLEALVDKSLLRHLEQTEEGDSRLGMLETVREYALEQLEASGEANAIRRRHADYYLELAERAEPGLESQDIAIWLNRLDREHDNFRAALSWLNEQGESEAADNALRILLASRNFWQRRSLSTEFQSWLERALAQGGPGPTPLRIKAIRRVGWLASKQGDYPRARAWSERALAAARGLGDKRLIASCLNTLAGVASLQRDYDTSRTLHEASLELYRELGIDDGIAMLLNNLGLLAVDQGDYERAESLLGEALDLYRSLGAEYRDGLMFAVANMGRLAQRVGDFKKARATLLEALALAHAASSTFAAAEMLLHLCGVILSDLDNPQVTPFQYLRSMELVARLSGFSAAVLERGRRHFEPLEQAEFDRNVAAARARLGEVAFTRAWEEGQAMTLDQALQLATQEPRARSISGAPGRPRQRAIGGLTIREYEVAGLVTQGLSNEEIARSLVLSERTVEMHVSSALHKLGLTTRTQLAAWAAEQGMTRGRAGS